MVSILIPAYNEAARIGDTVAAARRVIAAEAVEIVVVDDGSIDSTAEAATIAGADRVLRQKNAGKGAALRAALRAASGDILVLLDADLGATAAEARCLLTPILSGEADMTIATFPVVPGRGGGMGLVVQLARWGIRMLTDRTMAAPLSGQRALTRDTLDACGGFASGWGVEIALTVRALDLGYRVIEVETRMNHRVTGRSLRDAMHRARQLEAAVCVLGKLWWSRRRRARRLVEKNGRDG